MKTSSSKNSISKKKTIRHPMLPSIVADEGPIENISYISYLQPSLSQDLKQQTLQHSTSQQCTQLPTSISQELKQPQSSGSIETSPQLPQRSISNNLQLVQPPTSKLIPPQTTISEEELSVIERTYSLGGDGGDNSYFYQTSQYLTSSVTSSPISPSVNTLVESTDILDLPSHGTPSILSESPEQVFTISIPAIPTSTSEPPPYTTVSFVYQSQQSAPQLDLVQQHQSSQQLVQPEHASLPQAFPQQQQQYTQQQFAQLLQHQATLQQLTPGQPTPIQHHYSAQQLSQTAPQHPPLLQHVSHAIIPQPTTQHQPVQQTITPTTLQQYLTEQPALQQQFPNIPSAFAAKPMIVVMGQQVQTYYEVVPQSQLQFPNSVQCQPIQICHYHPPLPQTIVVRSKSNNSIPSNSAWGCFINPGNCFGCMREQSE